MNKTTKRFLHNLSIGASLFAIPIGLGFFLQSQIPETMAKTVAIIGITLFITSMVIEGAAATCFVWHKSKAWARENPKKTWLLTGTGILALTITMTQPVTQMITITMWLFLAVGVGLMGFGIKDMVCEKDKKRT